jgi:hypothetical protein
MSEETNRRIHEWLGKCWRDVENTDDEGICQTCALSLEWHSANPDYDTDPVAMLELIDAVRKKGHQAFMDNETGPYAVDLYAKDSATCVTGNADTLPAAVSAAVLKLIESEPKENHGK